MKKLLIAAVLLAAAAGAGFWYWQRGAQPAEAALVLYGNVDQRQIELAFMDAERIAEVLVHEGETVQQGQVLARLHTRRLEDGIAVAEAQLEAARAALQKLENGTRPQEIDQAKAAVAQAKAQVAYAEGDYRRFEAMWKSSKGQAISRQDFDKTRLALDVAKAQLQSAQKALRLAEIGPRAEDIAQAKAQVAERERALAAMRTQLADAELKSPVDSVVTRRLLEPGDMASPQRAVFSLAQLAPKWVRAWVSETQLGRIRPGQAAQIYVDSAPQQAIAGTVGFISSVAEFTPKSVETADLRTSLVYETRIYTDDPQNLLRLGMPATVRFDAP